MEILIVDAVFTTSDTVDAPVLYGSCIGCSILRRTPPMRPENSPSKSMISIHFFSDRFVFFLTLRQRLTSTHRTVFVWFRNWRTLVSTKPFFALSLSPVSGRVLNAIESLMHSTNVRPDRLYWLKVWWVFGETIIIFSLALTLTFFL